MRNTINTLKLTFKSFYHKKKVCTHHLDKKPGAGRMGGGREGLTGSEAIPRYKHYKNAITNAIHLQTFLFVTGLPC